MITQDMIKKAYTNGIIQLIESPEDAGVVCEIGDSFIYFLEDDNEFYDTVEECKENVSEEDIIRMIYETLCDIYEDGEDDESVMDDYLYYKDFLKEHGITED